MACGEPLTERGMFRLRIGAVYYDDNHGAQFIQEECDGFRDGTLTNWLCRECGAQNDVYIDDLEDNICGAVDGGNRCGQTFEPADSPQSETVIRLEWGGFSPNKSGKGPDMKFVPEVGGHIHFNCACDSWGIPIWDVEAQDTP